MHQGATAHGAGLERDEQFALWQTIVTQHLCGFSQCQHLGVGTEKSRTDVG